jgi:VanZ family protein
MNYFIHLLQKYPFSCCLIACIWVLCFCTIPHTPLDNVSFIDKWTHIAMYLFTCVTVWAEYMKAHKHGISAMKLFMLAWLAPVAMSGLIELLQAYCTGGRRSGEWLDFAANTTGASLAALIGILLVRNRARKDKEK